MTLALVIASSAVALAQGTDNNSTQQQQTERMQRKRHKRDGFGGKPMGMMRALRQLDLSEAQHQQVRSLTERFLESTKFQREELRQLHQQKRDDGTLSAGAQERARKLRTEMQAAHERFRADVIAVLTTEQRTKLEQLESEMRNRHEQMRERRRNRQDNDGDTQ